MSAIKASGSFGRLSSCIFVSAAGNLTTKTSVCRILCGPNVWIENPPICVIVEGQRSKILDNINVIVSERVVIVN